MSHFLPEQAKAEPPPPLGLYVHVPFCASTCDFCAFYQTRATAAAVERFLETISRERTLVNWTRPVSTVFWGGGTPGLLSADDLRRLAAALPLTQRSGRAEDEIEWTVELAPGS